MPPKIDSNQVTEILIRTVGGEVGSVSSLAPKIGPLGLSPKKLGEQLSNSTKEWQGLKIMCKLKVQNRQATVEVVPSSSSLIIRSLNEPKRDRKKVKNIKHNGAIEHEDLIKIAKILRKRSGAVKLDGTLKELIGTCKSIGCSIN
ncbi:60S ribosomal protein L12 (nucleomorph) [Guillardia theta]|uniref:60S ribosomal protein L12 n=1 Tax=Guillardia theta TaxID=55529 RepID=Q98RV3_GUITH|nr:60s ribosomal protein L12 [Guillardia theta]AAK39847.1 60S ribosomal protein L12 [Guillardia theta]|mmetsp:Transcript_32906/g.104053  ORF Transcript_32906/g.104053 Transcript_32906/m.104053 type:complete len:145 (-) Transcript_32906:2853-3287(-)